MSDTCSFKFSLIVGSNNYDTRLAARLQDYGYKISIVQSACLNHHTLASKDIVCLSKITLPHKFLKKNTPTAFPSNMIIMSNIKFKPETCYLGYLFIYLSSHGVSCPL